MNNFEIFTKSATFPGMRNSLPQPTALARCLAVFRVCFALLVSIIIVACASQPQQFPTGTFENTNGTTITFRPDGTYSVSWDGLVRVSNATYAVDGDQITFNDTETCPPGDVTYTWQFDGETLTFEPVGEDPCGGPDGRQADLTRPWTIQP